MSSEPRHDIAAEQAVLGAMMQDLHKQVFDDITTILTAGDFYRPIHGLIYETMLKVAAAEQPVDAITVAQTLGPTDLARVGGATYLHTLMQSTPTIRNGTYYARAVKELAILRDADTFLTRHKQKVAQASPQDAADVLEALQQEAAGLSMSGGFDDELPSWFDVADDATKEMERIEQLAASGQLAGVPTGFSDLDRLLNGLQGGQLIVVAGRPGIGKSVVGRGFFQNAAMVHGLDSFLFTLEMSKNECAMALISAGARVPLHNIRSGRLDDADWTRIARYLGETADAPAYIDDSVNGLAYGRQVLRRHIAKGRKPRLVVWDYAQITPIPGGGGGSRTRENDVAQLVRGFKMMAKEFDIPVVLLGQLNRGPEQRADKRPGLADLRESGSFEQDADVVILLHRDDYYDKESPRAGEMDFIVAKHRHGSTDTVTVAAQLHLQRCTDMAIV